MRVVILSETTPPKALLQEPETPHVTADAASRNAAVGIFAAVGRAEKQRLALT